VRLGNNLIGDQLSRDTKDLIKLPRKTSSAQCDQFVRSIRAINTHEHNNQKHNTHKHNHKDRVALLASMRPKARTLQNLIDIHHTLL